MEWFRFYSTVLHEPRVQTLPAESFRAWVNLLCVANLSSRRGIIRADWDEIAFALRLPDTDQAKQMVAELMGRGLFEPDQDGNFTPHRWGELQPDEEEPRKRGRTKRAPVEASPEAVDTYEKDFEDFWGEFPRHEDKARAKGLFMGWAKGTYKMDDGKPATVKMLLDATHHYAASRRGEDPKYTKMPGTFLAKDNHPWTDWIAGSPLPPKEPMGFSGLREYERRKRERAQDD